MTIRLLSRLPCNSILLLIFIVRLMDTFNRVLTSSTVEPCNKSHHQGEFYSQKCLNWKTRNVSYKNCCVVNYQPSNVTAASQIFRHVFIDESSNTSVTPYLYRFTKNDGDSHNVSIIMSLYFTDLSIGNCNNLSVSVIPKESMKMKRMNSIMADCWTISEQTNMDRLSLTNIFDLFKVFNACIIKRRISNRIELNSSNKYCHIVGQNKPHDFCNQPEHSINDNKKDSWKIHLKTNSTDLNVVNVTRDFPINELLNKYKRVQIKGDRGVLFCSSKRDRCCSCDNNCEATNSCCIDKQWDRTRLISLDSYLKTITQKPTNQKILSCEPIVNLKREEYMTTDYVAMVTYCSQSSMADEKSLCENALSDANLTLPVVGSDGYVYKNKYCAQCNDITQYKKISITAHCINNPSPKSRMGSIHNFDLSSTLGNCIHIDFNSSHLIEPSFLNCNNRPSSRQKRCINKHSPHYKLCHAYSGPIGSYANIHCYLCTHDDGKAREMVTLKPAQICKDTEYGQIKDNENEKFETQARWSMFISFIQWEKMIIVICGSETYINQDSICVQFSCAIGYERVYAGKWFCKEVTPVYPKTELKEPDYEKCLFAYKPSLFLIFNKTVANQLIETNNSYEEGFVRFYIDSQVMVLAKELSNITNLDAAIKVIQNSSLTRLATKTFIYPSSDPVQSEFYGFDLSRSFPQNKMCAHMEYVKPESVNFTSLCDVLYNERNISRMNISQYIELDNQLDDHTKKLYTCKKYHLHSTCRIINVTKTNGLSEDEYFPIKDRYQICAEDEEPKWLKYLVYIEAYFSKIGSSASIVSYIFIIVSILIFKKLRNISGLCSLALSSCLLLADGLFLLMQTISKLRTRMICHALGLSMHYCLIMAHVWAVIIAFDVSSKFSSFFYSSSRDVQRKKFYRYCIIAFTATTLFEIVSIVTDVTNLLHFGYGEDRRTCFIQGFYARLIFYIIPAMITSAFTFGSFLYILARIAIRKRRNKAFLRRSKRNNLSIFFIGLKLAFIFGSIELIGFIQIPEPDNYSLRLYNSVNFIIYSILRSLRGVLLFIVHICRRDVIRQYRESIRLYIQSE